MDMIPDGRHRFMPERAGPLMRPGSFVRTSVLNTYQLFRHLNGFLGIYVEAFTVEFVHRCLCFFE